MTSTTTKTTEATSYFTEPGGGWTIPGTEHTTAKDHALALATAQAAGFGSLVVDIVAGECTECLKMLGHVVTSS